MDVTPRDRQPQSKIGWEFAKWAGCQPWAPSLITQLSLDSRDQAEHKFLGVQCGMGRQPNALLSALDLKMSMGMVTNDPIKVRNHDI